MADTIRQRSELLALFADNTSGDISAQDLRDFTVTALGAYGGLYSRNSTTAAVACTAATARQLPAFNLTMPSSGVVSNATTDDLTVPAIGNYMIEAQVSLSSDVNDTDVTLFTRLAGGTTGHQATRLLTSSGDASSLSIVGIVTCSASQVIDLGIECDKNCNIQVVEAQIVCKMLG